MTTALAAQLAQIAANSKSTLDIKAQKAAHSKSLIFEPRVAASQNFQTLYSICYQGYEELCQLDSRFVPFGTTIFSEQSQNEDRTQMTAAENAELDKKIDSFLHLAGARIRLMPTIKAVEWLIRRFRIHEYNTAMLISTFLPYHTIPAFVTLLSILPSTIPQVYKFLDPYVRSLTQPPRSVLVHQATHHPDFLTALSTYTLDACRAQQHYPALISFWGGIMTEAVNGMLDRMRSGRRSIQRSNDQTLLHQIGPTLGDALVMHKVPSLQIACYMVISVFVAKGDLDDAAISALMDQLVAGWTTESLRPGLVCLSILAQYRSAKQMSGKVTRALLKITNLSSLLTEIGREHSIGKLANGLCLALVERAHKKGDIKGLSVVESLLLSSTLNDQQRAVVFKSLLLAAHKVEDGVDTQGEVRKALASIIIKLSQLETDSGKIFIKAINETEIDVDALELRLGTNLQARRLAIEPQQDVAMSDNEISTPAPIEDFKSALQRVGNLSVSSSDSCLRDNTFNVFTDLCSVFLSGLTEPNNLKAFEELAPIQHKLANETPFFFTFLMRIWCGPYPVLARVAALDMAKLRLKSSDCNSIDFQALLPYTLAGLNDPSKRVRRAAADLVTVLEILFQELVKYENYTSWANNHLYDNADASVWTTVDICHKLLRNAITPSLEECVLSADYIIEVLQSVLNSSSKTSTDENKDKKSHLSHGTRRSVLTFLASHTIHTPLMTLKIRLLASLNQVKGVSGTTRTQLLLPLLKWWSSLSSEDATRICSQDGVGESAFDQSCVEIVLPNDKDGLEFLLDVVGSQQLLTRLNLLHVIFSRIQNSWSSMKTEARHMVAKRMLELSQNDSSSDSVVSSEAANLLRNVDLTTDILLFFLESLQPAAKMATEPPSGKRRRTSSSETHRGLGTQPTPELSAVLRQVTFVLQLVEGSEPEKHPELLNALFNALSELQHFRVLVGSELGYLQNLILRSLLAMVPAYKNDKSLKIDSTGGHGDLLVNCIQKSSSPSVQNTALLLVARLANVAPDLVLNSVMPIFTHMGGSVLRQSDDYSAHVINQTVKEVVPPLIQSLRKGKISPLAGASELLLSFATAYEHIPSHRRLGLFVSLVETLGAEEFLFALLAMLTNMYGTTDQVLSFATEVFNYFPVEVQLQSLIKLLNLIGDIFQPRPNLSAVLLGTSEQGDRDPLKIGFRQLGLVPHLLSSRKLTTQIAKLTERDDMEASKVRELYSTLLEDLLVLADSLKQQKNLYSRCGEALSKLLNLLSIGEFIKAVETLLDRPDTVLRRKVLRAVEVRIDEESQGDANSRAALLAFLPHLTAIIRVSDDMAYKHIAVGCVDKISEKYGKKDPEAVTAAASTIASDQCLGQDDDKLRVMALLCLASLVDVLQDGIVPVLPSAIPKALSYITESIKTEVPGDALHNASYAFIAALAQHLPYMLSGAYLGQLLAVSSKSASANLGNEANDARLQCLRLLATQVDAKILFSALEQNWVTTKDSGSAATREYINILGVAIDKHSKADISKNAGSLSSIFFSAFDLRRLELSKTEVSEDFLRQMPRIEEATNDVALKMIYKLNDAAFRPIFSQLMDWSISLPKKDTTGRSLRLLSVYGFLLSFFGSLKSIVTSYASYIIDSAVDVLRTASLKKAEERDLWKRVLHTLAKSFQHDQDDFWQAPAHFNAIAPSLVTQFAHASSINLVEDLIPAIVELAAAADSQEHQKELNSALLKHLRSEQTSIRLAAVKCEQALTNRLGEEWLSMLPEMLPYISELQDDDDDDVERETHRWIVGIEGVLGESLDAMLQ
ncbi:U3 small nucleolar RNA-associated protein 10 [Daldinia childiae]|uniref:U3 small nucleolar RNA-associated protein 10 n=1 Tax=Daldinia childiae TaxID=326645 RepID=UPI00144887B1|nr:U3 small nucleolar RNA-associated protein 10 [Daldinia childiae]KAF3064052.1 U3 small nucleolar RNA-associated protein 10 [Daldinia childiae]